MQTREEMIETKEKINNEYSNYCRQLDKEILIKKNLFFLELFNLKD
jgi:hypothetical protein